MRDATKQDTLSLASMNIYSEESVVPFTYPKQRDTYLIKEPIAGLAFMNYDIQCNSQNGFRQ